MSNTPDLAYAKIYANLAQFLKQCRASFQYILPCGFKISREPWVCHFTGMIRMRHQQRDFMLWVSADKPQDVAQDKRSKMFTLSELMILHYLREHQKITLKQAAKTIQETDDNAHKVLNALRDEGLLELNGKTYMLSLKVYETVKTDVAYVQDKTVSQIQAKDRILEYLKHKPSITNQKAQELCGFNKNQTYYILHQMCKDGILQPDGVGRGTKYKSVK